MDPRLRSLIDRVIGQLRNGDYEQLVEEFLPQLRPLIPTAVLRSSWENACQQIGPISSIGEPQSVEMTTNAPTVRVLITGASGAFVLIISVAEGPALSGIQIVPADTLEPPGSWESPIYARPSAFHEVEVTLGEGALAVPGTLSLPTSNESIPAVVLLAGSGPCDRDGTLGPLKPLKDIAWGLASSNIAVLRFDKTTATHPEAASANSRFTIDDEYVTDALSAIAFLRGHPSIDRNQIFLAGHSLGGTVAPLVAQRDGSLAGVIILAGGAEPLHHAILRQLTYLAGLNPSTKDQSISSLEAMQRQVELIDSDELDLSTPRTQLPFGVPAAYWLMLRSFEPAREAARLRCPIFIAQGGRDYQVTVEDDLARWKTSLADSPNVEIHVYPDDNHLFVHGTQMSTPLDYLVPGHVDEALIRDLITWVASLTESSY